VNAPTAAFYGESVRDGLSVDIPVLPVEGTDDVARNLLLLDRQSAP
jgi:hypothetical protein